MRHDSRQMTSLDSAATRRRSRPRASREQRFAVRSGQYNCNHILRAKLSLTGDEMGDLALVDRLTSLSMAAAFTNAR